MFNMLYHSAPSLWQHKLKFSCAMFFAVLEAICKVVSNSTSVLFLFYYLCCSCDISLSKSSVSFSYFCIYSFFHVTFATLWKSVQAKHFLLASIASLKKYPLRNFLSKESIIWNKTMSISFETAQPQLVVYSVSCLEKHIILSKVGSLLNKKTKQGKMWPQVQTLGIFWFLWFFFLFCFIVCMRNHLGQS